MLRRTSQLESIETSIIDQILQSYSSLDYKNKQLLKKCLSNVKQQTAFIRDVIIQQGISQKKGYMILSGTVLITKRVASGKLVFSQLGAYHIVNIQVLMYDRTYYTAAVHSSQIKFITIPQQILAVLYNHLKETIAERETTRNKQIDAKMKQLMYKQTAKVKQKMVDQLSLPALKYFSKQSRHTEESHSLTRKITSRSPKLQEQQKGLAKQRSESMPKSMNKNFDFKVILNPKIKNKQASTLDTSEDRHERIFKEQLKTIIKRKLTYQRKQLGVLKAYRHNHDGNVIYEEDYRNVQPEDNQIDQYFKF